MYKTKRKYQGEPIRTDPTVDPKENETALHFSGSDRYAWVSSYEESVVAGLLAHPDFKIVELVLMRLERKDSVVGVVGKIPVAALRIGNSRQSGKHALIVPRILKAKLFSPPAEAPAREKKAPSRNGEPASKTKLPLLKSKSKPASKSAAKAEKGKKPVKEKAANAAKPAKRSKKKMSENQLLLIPLALGAKGSAKQKASSNKSTAKAAAISSRKARALKPKLARTKTKTATKRKKIKTKVRRAKKTRRR